MLYTGRLIIRPFSESDYKDLYEYLSLPETYRYEPGEPVILEQAKQLARERACSVNWWAAVLKETKKLIGHVTLFPIEPKQFLTWEIGFIFNPVFQNKGYASETACAVIKYAFTELGAHRVVGYCNPENIPSCRVLEKCGMKREGYFRKKAFFRKGAGGQPLWFDSCEYAVLAEDFLL